MFVEVRPEPDRGPEGPAAVRSAVRRRVFADRRPGSRGAAYAEAPVALYGRHATAGRWRSDSVAAEAAGPGYAVDEAPVGGNGLAAVRAQIAAAEAALAEVDLSAEADEEVAEATTALLRLRNRLDARLVELVREVDVRDAHRAEATVNVTGWLRLRGRLDHNAAARLRTASHRLSSFPLLAERFGNGEVTLSHVFAVTDSARPHRLERMSEFDEPLAKLATTNPPRDVRRAVRRITELLDADGSDTRPLDDGRDPRRELFLSPGVDGLGMLRATLDPEAREGLTALLDALDEPDPEEAPRRSAAQRRHDAFAALISRALGIDDLPTVHGARPHVLLTVDLAALLGLDPADPRAVETLRHLARTLGLDLEDLGVEDLGVGVDGAGVGTEGAEVDGGGAGLGGDDIDAPHPFDTADPARDRDPHAHATNPSANGHTADAAWRTDTRRDAAWHGARGDPAVVGTHPPPLPRPVARFGSGTPLSLARARHVAQRATVQAVLTLGPWRAVNVGARHRTLPAWLRTVLRAMHQHCRGPGCDRPVAWSEAHHQTPWQQARTTDLNDTLPLCRAHHAFVTTHGWDARLDHDTGDVTWTAPDGRVVTVPPSY